MINIQYKRHILIVAIVSLLLLIPLISMQFTDEVNLTLIDFIVAASLLLSTGFSLNFVIRHIKNTHYRIALSLATFIVFLLIWVELAVGIFGTPFGGQ